MDNLLLLGFSFIGGCVVAIVALALVRGNSSEEVKEVKEEPIVVETPPVEEVKPIKKKRVYKPRKPKADS